MAEAQWFVAHTYSGYENKVKVDIEKTIENRGLQEKSSDKKLFPGYVLIHMYMNDETWYVVRNTRGVTGFVGPGSKPVPLTEDELVALGYSGNAAKPEARLEVDLKEGDMVTVISGAWKDTVGVITAVNEKRKTVSINVEMFGRETKVELEFTEVKKM